jgi:HD-GYP domain-containing protein (c-di-GMP phosphodiesterase class II)
MAQLHETGLVHDVGKIGVPDAILLKPGPLTPEEYEIVKRHATLGAEIVAETLPPQQVMWVRHHHERYDGAGYPDGLAGDDIPDGSRIIAVADSWDVMTTDRPYRMGVPVEKALREVQEHSGRQFCPAAVELLEQLWDAGVLAGG